MKSIYNPTKKRTPTCLVELDFEILCKLEGKEFAIKTFLLTDALRKESAADSSQGRQMPSPPKIPIKSE